MRVRLLGLMALALAGFVSDSLAGEHTTPSLKVRDSGSGESVVVHEGTASYYADHFDGQLTASGQRFRSNKLTGASRKLPLGAHAVVTNLENGRSVEILINDRGPFIPGRIVDLSKQAAKRLDMIESGISQVRIEVKPSRQPDRKVRARLETMVTQVAEATQQ
ncbi:MAG TPA: septal ring lytic transglycosylase RlpA family protein [Azospirillum sp.]|nr:septal ring lytic transglycosylase RlpA family protein [Azospirillum sp.]